MDKDQALAVLRDNPQAALELGRRIVATADIDDRRHAEVPFEIARNADPTTAWSAADAYAQVADGRAARWMAEGAASLSDPDGIAVDRLTLPIRAHEYDEDRWIATDQDWRIAVHCDQPDLALVALRAARDRLSFVTNDGRLLSGPDEPTEPPEYTPNGIFLDEPAVQLWLDCQGSVFPLMARTVLQVVIDELRAAGISRAEISTPQPGNRC